MGAAMSEVLAMLGPVKCIDVLEIFRDLWGLAPKGFRRCTGGAVLVVAMLTRPEWVQSVVVWIGQKYSERYMQIVTDTLLVDVAVSQLA